ncbi:MAG: class I SAM-dependent methyltransferase [Acidimicrobiia bacterium]|nr:class I SAM-dependent methyltransferase [Acidimicrobiia bacterium]
MSDDRAGYQGVPEWRHALGDSWLATVPTADRQFAPLTGAALDALGVAAGQRALDVGCGVGSTTLEIARRVAPTGSVVGIDVSPTLAGEARRRLARWPAISIVEGDAQTHDLGDARFDVIHSRLGVMFFEDAVAAFTNLRRAVRRDGALAFTCWQGIEHNPWMSEVGRALIGHVDIPRPAPPGAPGAFSFADPYMVRAVMGNAGWTDLKLEPIQWSVGFESPEELAALAPANFLLAPADAATRRRAVDALVEAIGERGSFDYAAWLVSCRPGSGR